MLLIWNFTGLKRTYWLPSIKRKSDGFGIWFLEVRWLGVELVVYSREMGSEFIRRLNVDRDGEAAQLRAERDAVFAELRRILTTQGAWCSRCGKTESGHALSAFCSCGYERLVWGAWSEWKRKETLAAAGMEAS